MKRNTSRTNKFFSHRGALRAAALLLAVTALLLASCRSVRIAVVSRTASEGSSPEQSRSEALSSYGQTSKDPSKVSFDGSQESENSPEVSPSEEPSTETPELSTETPEPSSETPEPDYPAPEFLTEQYFIYDVQKEKIISIGGNDRVIYPASTTKLLTILYAKTLVALDLMIMPGNEQEMVGPNSSRAWISTSHPLSAEMLIEGMLLPSGNDAAYALAAAAGRVLDPDAADGKAAVAAFVKGMNEYGKSLGLKGSSFISPDGYDNDAHYATLEDMALIASLAYKDETIRKFASLPQDDVTFYPGRVKHWDNTNLCINPESPYYLPEVNGMKTGAVSRQNYCIVSSAVIAGREFIFGFYSESAIQNRFIDTQRAVEWVKENVLS